MDAHFHGHDGALLLAEPVGWVSASVTHQNPYSNSHKQNFANWTGGFVQICLWLQGVVTKPAPTQSRSYSNAHSLSQIRLQRLRHNFAHGQTLLLRRRLETIVKLIMDADAVPGTVGFIHHHRAIVSGELP